MITHRNSFPYKLCVEAVCERPDFSMVKWCENSGAFWEKETELSHYLGDQ
jgi:hypothetical protein